MSDALMGSYKLAWDEFCSWYLEMVKPEYGKPLSVTTYKQVIEHLENLLRVLHPFMPFITEEIYQNIQPRTEGDSLMINHWPEKVSTHKLTADFDKVKNIISEIRTIRKEKNISFKEQLELKVAGGQKGLDRFYPVIKKLTNLSSVESVSEKVENSVSFLIDGTEYFVPVGNQIDVEAEKAKIEEEIKYNEGFLKSVEKKLSNERFVSNAPAAVVETEKKKQADAHHKLEILRKQLASL